jgi:hypothetical protein
VYIRNLFLGGCLAGTFFGSTAHAAPLVTAKLTEITLLARMLFKPFLLFFRDIDLAP